MSSSGLEKESPTRRAPHMERYVKIVVVKANEDDEWDEFPLAKKYKLFLEVDKQRFEIGNGYNYESLGHVECARDMLCIALDKIEKGKLA